MSEEPVKTRRRLSDDEKVARAKSQIEMIEKRKAEKHRERIEEARVLIQDVPGAVDAYKALGAWLEAHKP